MIDRTRTVGLGVLAVVALAGPLLAEPAARSRVALVLPSPSDALLREVSTRLRAELSGAGFEVVEVDPVADGTRSRLEHAAVATQSFAAVDLESAGTGAFADVWIGTAPTGQTAARRLGVGTASNAAAVLAIRVLELLRASLLELDRSEPAVEPLPVPAPSDTARGPREKAPQYPANAFAGTAISLGVLGLHDLGALGGALGPVARIWGGIGARLFVRGSVAAPLLSRAVHAAQGEASVSQHFATVDLGWCSPARPIGLFAWAGVGASVLHTSGSAAPPNRATQSGVFAFAASAGLGAVARVRPELAVTAEAFALALVPHPVVVIANDELGRAGMPSIGATLSVQLAL